MNTPELSHPQQKELNALKKRKITYDDDLPKFTEDQLKEFRRVAKDHHAGRTKQTVTLRLSPATLQKARSLGPGYTSVMSRLLDIALNDPEMIRKAL